MVSAETHSQSRQLRAQPSAGRALVYREVEGVNGAEPRMIAFEGVEFRPLDFDALTAAKVRKPLTIPMGWDRAKVTGTNIEGLDLSAFYSANATLESAFTSHAIGLVQGGWLPSGLAATRDDAIVLLDSNLMSELLGRFGKGKSAKPDFLDLFADRPVRINPLLFIMEGTERKIPTLAEMEARLAKEAPKLQAALPQAQVLSALVMLQGAAGLIADGRDAFASKLEFLLQVAPLLAAPVGRARRSGVCREIFAAAARTNVRPNALVVLAALSVASRPHRDNPSRGLLKFKPAYGPGEAYNALADLRALELLVGLFAQYPNEQIQLCTCDLPLARFWTGLQASNFRRDATAVSFDLRPVEALLPAEAKDDWGPVLTVVP